MADEAKEMLENEEQQEPIEDLGSATEAEDELEKDWEALLARATEDESGDESDETTDKPEKSEEEGVPAPETEESKAEDESPSEEEALPEEPKSNDDWKRMRLARKKDQEELEELRKQVATKTALPVPDLEIPGEHKVVDTAPKAPPQAEPEVRPETAFSVLAGIAGGDESLLSYKMDAQRHILSKMTPGQIAEVQRQALLKNYGEQSEAIEDLCSKYLPIVNATWQENAEARKVQEQGAAQREKSWEAVIGTMPNLRDKSSDQYRGFAVASADLLKSIPTLWDSPNAPTVVAEYMGLVSDRQAKETLAAENVKLKEQVAQLTKRLGSKHAAPGGGQPSSGGGKKAVTADQELDTAFKRMGFD